MIWLDVGFELKSTLMKIISSIRACCVINLCTLIIFIIFGIAEKLL